MMYDLLLELPIFQGLSYEQLTLILEKVPFHFKKYRNNENLVTAGDRCEEVIFLLSGRVRMITPVFGDKIVISEDFDAPHTIPFSNFFGHEVRSRCGVYAQGAVGAMTLNKANFLTMLENNRLMLINVLNILSTHAQKNHYALDSIGEKEPEMRLASWLLAYTQRPAKNIIVDASAEDWCSLLHVDAETLQKTIKILAEEKYLEFDSGKMKLTDRYGLRTYVSRNKALK